MNTDILERARETIEIIMAKLDQSLIKSQFDEPIAKVAKQFKYKGECPITHKAFHKIIADFVERIYAKAFNTSWMLTEPLVEAIFLLENHYHSTMYGDGYTAAILDADDASAGGIQTVLTVLAESIKEIERQKYISGVFTWHLYVCSWELRCEIARLLLEDYRQFIPERLHKYNPALLVDEIPSIMYRHICSNSALQQISFCNEKPLTAEVLFDGKML